MTGQNTATPGIPPKTKHTGLIVGGIIAVIVLVGAAFVAGRLLNQSNAPTANGPQMMLNTNGPGGGQAFSLELERAKELPQAAPDVSGLFERREDQSVFVKALSGGRVMMKVDPSGKVTTQSDSPEQLIEVVLTKDTTIYRDATEINLAQPSSGKVQQQVEPGSIDELGENSMIQAWGERRGDRLIAKTVMYSKPMIFSAPAQP